MEKERCCCEKTKARSEKEYKDLITRLNRIEGQVRGIKKMGLYESTDCLWWWKCYKKWITVTCKK